MQMVKTRHIECIILFVYGKELCVLVGSYPVGCGRPGPVFGPVLPVFLPVECHTGLLLWQCRHSNLGCLHCHI
jgi:hypothetical protein